MIKLTVEQLKFNIERLKETSLMFKNQLTEINKRKEIKINANNMQCGIYLQSFEPEFG